MADHSSHRNAVVAAAVTGVGLSGFFDGILLHQVLQWHHLLSLVPGEALRDIRNQILADGLFHVLMYAVTATGLAMLWRARRQLTGGEAGWRAILGGFLLGFGIWNLIDVGFFHWILGIHRIRVNVPNPMAYDLGWLAVLGLLPLAAGWLILRKRDEGGGGRATATLSLAALIAAPLASLPVPGSRTALVLLDHGGTPSQPYELAVAAGTPVLWADPDGAFMIVDLQGEGASAALYRAGAAFVTRSPALAGCAAALRG